MRDLSDLRDFEVPREVSSKITEGSILKSLMRDFQIHPSRCTSRGICEVWILKIPHFENNFEANELPQWGTSLRDEFENPSRKFWGIARDLNLNPSFSSEGWVSDFVISSKRSSKCEGFNEVPHLKNEVPHQIPQIPLRDDVRMRDRNEGLHITG